MGGGVASVGSVGGSTGLGVVRVGTALCQWVVRVVLLCRWVVSRTSPTVQVGSVVVSRRRGSKRY